MNTNINRIKVAKIRHRLTILLVIFSFAFLPETYLMAQTGKISLDEAQSFALKNYPIVKNLDLVRESGRYSVNNAASGYLPSVSLNGQYTYQSDVTKLPIELPNMQVPQIDKEQYKVYAEISQIVYDGGAIHARKEAAEALSRIEEKSIETELYKIKERVNQLYFSILLINSQAGQVNLMKEDLKAGLTKAEGAYRNGTILKSNVDAVRAEMIKTDQRILELSSMKQAYLKMLSLFTGQDLDESTVLEIPPALNMVNSIERPELELFQARIYATEVQSKAINAKNLPRLNLFFQGGYGSPALNMLDPDADTYYITGVRFAYPLTGFYNKHREKKINSLTKQNLQNQREAFIFNTQLQINQQDEEIEKLQSLISSDDEIITLRDEIKNASLVQLENGVITSADYIREVTAADNARQSKAIHEIQLLMAQYNHQLITGKEVSK